MGNVLNSIANFEGSERSNGYNWSTTADQVVGGENADLTGKNIIVTGSNTGIGKETVRVLAGRGANVIMACRDLEKAESAAKDVRAVLNGKGGQVSVMKLDLGSLQSVRDFAKEFNAKNIPLHVLICNAGIMACPYSETLDGFETQFGVNHLGHFLLTNLLLERLKEGKPSRIVVLASAAHHATSGHVMFDDLKGKDTWYTGMMGPWKAYGQSKSANILFACELDKRMKEQNAGVSAYSCHPGSIKTELGRHLGTVFTLAMTAGQMFTKSIPQGAATSVFLAVSPKVADMGGRYFSDSNPARPDAAALDPEQAKKLWEVSVKMVGL
eukprot:comp18262_c0_seq1/m.19262 comp18262_c0_seq1/g.19262  ORF comp18262_c0_seq1/g.19262 comp18262_c0_seq1/m.19262 type:complete len:326 (-) comp18262_c0_seq1:51-1028(-)